MSSRSILLAASLVFALGAQDVEADRGRSGGSGAGVGSRGFTSPNSGYVGSSTSRDVGTFSNRSGDGRFGGSRAPQYRSTLPGGMDTGTRYPRDTTPWRNSDPRAAPSFTGAPAPAVRSSGAIGLPGRPYWQHDSRRFNHADHFHHWKHGRWHHGHHHDRFGWWWIVGPSWFFYPAAIYPYPDPYVPGELVVEPQNAEGTHEFWYYCEDPQGYYPYVAECSRGWQRVASEADTQPPPP